MKHFQDVVLSSLTGLPVSGVQVTVLVAATPPGSGALATIYSDDGVTTAANPLTTGPLGRFDFYAPDGRYDIVFSGPAITSFTLADVEIADVTQVGPGTGDASWNVRNLTVTGSLTASGNSTFTGTNTHSGSETFTGGVTVSTNPLTVSSALTATGGGTLTGFFGGDPFFTGVDFDTALTIKGITAASTRSANLVFYDNQASPVPWVLRKEGATFVFIAPSGGVKFLADSAVNRNIVEDTATQTLTNKTLTAPVINTLGPSTGQQHTVPAVTSDTFALLAAAQTLTNKTLTSPVINGTVTGTALQGTDTKLLTAGTITGTGATLCTDANGGATTSGCTAGGSTEVLEGCSGVQLLSSTTTENNGACPVIFLPSAHTLIRFGIRITVAGTGCTGAPTVAVKDVTTGTDLTTIVVGSWGIVGNNDSGVLNIAMTAGHEFAMYVKTAATGCTVNPNGKMWLVYQ
jgi:hypothetical protein